MKRWLDTGGGKIFYSLLWRPVLVWCKLLEDFYIQLIHPTKDQKLVVLRLEVCGHMLRTPMTMTILGTGLDQESSCSICNGNLQRLSCQVLFWDANFMLHNLMLTLWVVIKGNLNYQTSLESWCHCFEHVV